jgi:hypothetical protein
MKRQRFIFAGAAVLAAACGTAAVEVQTTGEEDLAQTEQGLELKVQELFGPDARVGRLFGRGAEVLVGVALEGRVEDADVPEPLALASLSMKTGALTMVEQAPGFKEALRVGESLALVTTEGELKVRAVDGAERLLASGVKGEISSAPNGGLLFTADTDGEGTGDTRVVLAAADGALNVLADAEGVDDRGSLSPDGVTVVFVSGRTGMASLFRTTIHGGAPVQLTNIGLTRPELPELSGDEVDVAEDAAPAGFVPPPVSSDVVTWLSADVVRFDAGGGEFWKVDVRSGVATREGGAQ